ncbi:CLUMA_CG020523, isoform A [Clunio marinus]|uniref:CLUMA_CG020523, isoform A n=1 Tax=Clunio marinus TaxID=568069 RepID=A0A1J1J7V5_9DIPT|nr:CLUMA_CG020523, isoform A [Clunio marinus]
MSVGLVEQPSLEVEAPLETLNIPEEQPAELAPDPNTPLRKRQRHNFQDVYNTKPSLAPIRASGRIRIKMTAAAEQKPPEPSVKPVKIVFSQNSNKQRRKVKKLKTDLSSELAIDVKRPSSVLVDTSIRALLTNVAFSQLSPENQKILIESLPLVDRPTPPSKENECVELNPSSINNEFFNRACIEWRDRLSNGEFTNEHQTKLRAEHEKEKSKIDPWKARNFEGIWGIKSNGHGLVNVGAMMEKSAMEMKERVEQGDFEIPEGFISEVWKGEQNEDEISEMKDESTDLKWEIESSPSQSQSPSQNPSISTSQPTPPEAVSSTQPEPSESIETPSHVTQIMVVNSPESLYDQPVIAEATSKHDYLKNVIEPEPSGMEEMDVNFDNEMECALDNETDESAAENTDESIRNDNIETLPRIVNNTPRIIETNSRINSYDSELPQEIFHKPEDVATTFQPNNSSSVLINNFVHHQEPVLVRQVIEQAPTRYSRALVMQDEQNETPVYNNEDYGHEDADIEDTRAYRDEIHMNVPKNVKLLAFPSGVKYNEKYIIEETQPQQIHATTSFRTNGSQPIQQIPNSYFVPGTNFTYISKMGNKIENAEPTRIIKQEANNNQGQMKQRIIYEIATEPKFEPQPQAHHVTFAAPPQQEIFHQMVKHPNGTTTIYETTAPAAKKTIIQRKKTVDPYTVQVVANNNTIILTPIGSTTQQTVQQPQKSIVHIHRTAPMIQTTPQPVQFLSAPQTYLKKQTIIHPQMTTQKNQQQLQQPKFTTVIRTTSMSLPPQPQVVTTVSSKIQRPIQKQKVIMSTSSLQQYRYNQKPGPSGHGSRKQLHPQHIIRPSPTATTATVIHHQMTSEPNTNQIPVILPTARSDHVIMSTAMSNHSNQIPAAQPTVVTIGPPPCINNIYVRPKRPQQIFQTNHQHLSNMMSSNPSNNNNIPNNNLTNNNLNNQHQQQSMIAAPPRMRHQQNNQRPPPGTVNLERSYQICQAVIQNSTNPNRHQLNNQLKPPPLMGQKKF